VGIQEPHAPTIRAIAAPAPPTAPAAPTLAFASCVSDDAAMLRVPARAIDAPGYKKRGYIRTLDWYPSSLVPTADNQAIPYVYGPCAFSDMADAIATAFGPEHRIYLIGWSTNKDVSLRPGLSLEQALVNTRAQVRALFYDGKIAVTPLLKISIGVENKWVTDAINGSATGAALIDSRLPPLAIHHQKLLVVQGQFGAIAFLGGMDFDPSRIEQNPDAGRPWHDVHLRVVGPAALECRRVFEDRWLDHPGTAALDRKLGASATATAEDRRAIAFPRPQPVSMEPCHPRRWRWRPAGLRGAFTSQSGGRSPTSPNGRCHRMDSRRPVTTVHGR
jgi:hypothetical protein